MQPTLPPRRVRVSQNATTGIFADRCFPCKAAVSERVPPRRCRCEEPLLQSDDVESRCVICGREAAIRLPRVSESAPAAMNGAGAETSVRRNGSNPLSMNDRKLVSFVCPIDLAEGLQELAVSRERTVSAELRLMVRQHLNESATPAKGDALKDTAMREPVGEQV